MGAAAPRLPEAGNRQSAPGPSPGPSTTTDRLGGGAERALSKLVGGVRVGARLVF